MGCKRCGGFMTLEVTSPLLEGFTQLASQCARCLNCGNMEDSVICLNRLGDTCAHGSIARPRQGIRL